MNRRRFALLPLTALALLRPTAGVCAEGGAKRVAGALPSPHPITDAGRSPVAGPATDAYPPVVPGRVFVFPDDEGSHPSFRIEWWYLTGWLTDEASKVSGFQLTFFRSRPVDTGGNPSRFTPTQLFIAHIA
ncbi:MAG: lipocalin-like domain-containing protein, partial [Casimicrobiaceae bacterium]